MTDQNTGQGRPNPVGTDTTSPDTEAKDTQAANAGEEIPTAPPEGQEDENGQEGSRGGDSGGRRLSKKDLERFRGGGRGAGGQGQTRAPHGGQPRSRFERGGGRVGRGAKKAFKHGGKTAAKQGGKLAAKGLATAAGTAAGGGVASPVTGAVTAAGVELADQGQQFLRHPIRYFKDKRRTAEKTAKYTMWGCVGALAVFIGMVVFISSIFAIFFPTPAPATPISPTAVGGAETRQLAIDYARAQIPRSTYIFATPSRNWGRTNPPIPVANAPTHYDCSGLVGWAYYWATNGETRMIGQTALDWFRGSSTGKFEKHPAGDGTPLMPGDLVYFKGALGSWLLKIPGHVGIYTGDSKQCGRAGNGEYRTDCFIHIFSTGRPPAEQSMSTKSYFIGFLRPVLE